MSVAAIALSLTDLYWLVGGTLSIYLALRWNIREERKALEKRKVRMPR